MRIFPLALLAILALTALLAACNKQPAESADADPVAKSAGSSSTSPGEPAPTAEASADSAAPAGEGGRVELNGSPVKGFWLPEGSTIMGTDDQLPKGWTVSFDSPADWPELVKQMEAQLQAKGWTLDKSNPDEKNVVSYNSPDDIHFALLMNVFPDPPEQPKTTEYVQALGQIEMARQANPDFAFGIYLRVE